MRLARIGRGAGRYLAALLFLLSPALLSSQDPIPWEPVATAPEVAPGVVQVVADGPEQLYALSEHGVFVSDGEGDRWENLIAQGYGVRRIALTSDSRLLVGTSNGLFVFAPDGGLLPLGDGLFDEVAVSDISVTDRGEILVTGLDRQMEGKVWISRDGGRTWDTWEAWGERTDVRGVVRFGEEYLLWSRSQVLRTTDGGVYWKKMNFSGGTDVEEILQIASSPDASVLYACIDAVFSTPKDGLYRLALGEGYWEQVFWHHPEQTRAVIARSASEVYLATTAGIFHSLDSGTTWDTLLTTAEQTSIEQTESLHLQGDSLYVGTATEMIRVDLQSGRVDHISRGFGPGDVTSMTWLADSTLMLTVGDRLYRSSSDGELRWVEVDPRESAGIEVSLGDYIVTEGYDGGTLLYGRPSDMDTAHYARLLWSADGINWEAIDSGLTGYRLHEVAILDDRSMMVEGPYFSPPNRLDFGAYEYLRSADGGATWSDPGFGVSSNKRGVSPFVFNGTLSFHIRAGELLYRSTAAAPEWELIDTLRGERVLERLGFLGMFRNGTTFVRQGDTLLVSRDGGESWTPAGSTVSRGYPIYYLYHTALLIYGTHTGELFLSRDNGDTWEPMTDEAIPSGLKVIDIFSLPSDGLYMTVENPGNEGGASIYRTVRGSVSGVDEGPGELPAVLLLR